MCNGPLEQKAGGEMSRWRGAPSLFAGDGRKFGPWRGLHWRRPCPSSAVQESRVPGGTDTRLSRKCSEIHRRFPAWVYRVPLGV